MNHSIFKSLFSIFALSSLLSLSFSTSRVIPPDAPSYFPASCKVSGSAKVNATGMGMTYGHKFDLSYQLKFHTEDPKAVAVDITHEGHTSTMKGVLINDTLIQLTEGQHIPQNFDGDGFSAQLTGVVKKGFLTCSHAGNVRLFADLDASGQLLVMSLPIPVKGTIETDAHN